MSQDNFFSNHFWIELSCDWPSLRVTSTPISQLVFISTTDRLTRETSSIVSVSSANNSLSECRNSIGQAHSAETRCMTFSLPWDRNKPRGGSVGLVDSLRAVQPELTPCGHGSAGNADSLRANLVRHVLRSSPVAGAGALPIRGKPPPPYLREAGRLLVCVAHAGVESGCNRVRIRHGGDGRLDVLRSSSSPWS